MGPGEAGPPEPSAPLPHSGASPCPTRPSLCLYFTDMDCDRYPDAEPRFPVVWCEWGEGVGHWRQPPPWGDHITIRD